jgi:predicted nucleic acid-binding protein
MRIFIDSDVVISSLLSSTGAAYFLLNQSKIQPVISSFSLIELQLVAKRLDIPLGKMDQLIKERFEIVKIFQKFSVIQQEYGEYVTHTSDSHIVAGASQAKVRFLISYNLKHFKTDKINSELDVLLITPAILLQHLRSH